MPAPAIAILGGTGLYALPGLQDREAFAVSTPFGSASAPLVRGRLGGRSILFLARHGAQHGLLPHEINVRANLYALKAAGATHVIAVSAVGSLREGIAPGDVVLPDQLVDVTRGRASTFFGHGVAAHVSFGEPVCATLAATLAAAATPHGAVHHGGTYVCIEGPRFSSRRESELWRAAGADVVGMTALPEASLAREAELCYALLAMPTDYDAWRRDTEPVTAAQVTAQLSRNVAHVLQVLP
ncbi:MAG TPA: S-methyl-5'-thioadenosine phosphorylase, partial [Myxococcota bacterium]|nr:S-methyl-5'-thioadenosine phosphorylase [Myxococcota bacterium]